MKDDNKKIKNSNKGLILLTIALIFIASFTYLIAKGTIIKHSMALQTVSEVSISPNNKYYCGEKEYTFRAITNPANSYVGWGKNNANINIVSSRPDKGYVTIRTVQNKTNNIIKSQLIVNAKPSSSSPDSYIKSATIDINILPNINYIFSSILSKIDLTVGKTFNFGSTLTVTPQVSSNYLKYSSSNSNVAIISSTGVITAVGKGSATITAEGCGGLKKEITVEVDKNIPVTGLAVKTDTSSNTIYVGNTIDLIPTITPTNATNKTLIWTIDGTTYGRINNQDVTQTTTYGGTGITVKGIKAGTVNVTVKTQDGNYSKTVKINVINKSGGSSGGSGGGSGSSVVKVTGISVSPTSKTININETISLDATVKPSNASNKTVKWTSSDTSVATVNQSGVVTGKKVGTATITARTEDGGYTATSKITVSNNGGTITKVPVKGISINPTTVIIDEEDLYSLSSVVTPSNATNKSVKWTSSNTSVVTVNSSGVIVGLTPGVAKITVTTVDGGYTATSEVTVMQLDTPVRNIKVSPLTYSMYVGDETYLTKTIAPDNATNKTVTWTSSNPSVATVDSTGTIKALKVGTTTITVKTEDGSKTATSKITVKAKSTPTPVNPTPSPTPQNISVSGVTITSQAKELNVGEAMYLTAQVSPSNASNKSVTWTSSNPSVATVDDNGMVLGVSAGTTTITGTTVDGGKSSSITITITGTNNNEIPVNDITINTNYVELKVRQRFTLYATVLPENATNKNVLWSSSDTNVVSVDAKGNIRGINPGYATITATSETGGKSITVDVMVKENTSNVKLPLLILGGILLIIFIFGILYFILKGKKNNSY